MCSVTWNPQTEKKFKEAICKMPLFHRRIAEKLVKERSEIITGEREKQEVGEEEMVLAFFKEVPAAFKGLMKRLLTDVGVDYKKYVDEG